MLKSASDEISHLLIETSLSELITSGTSALTVNIDTMTNIHVQIPLKKVSQTCCQDLQH